MQLIDTHAHIYLPAFDADQDEAIKRAVASGVTMIAMPAVDSTTHTQMLAAAARWEPCKAMMGLHPCSVKADFETELAVVETYLKEQPFLAVGEIGLDFYWDTTFKQQQYEAFEKQIQWALAYRLPVVIHSRNALDECIEVISRYPGVRGVFHCFSGTVVQAKKITDLKFFLGIGGVLTYKKAGLDAVIQAIGPDAVVLETDAPYLAPVPHRGKRNESSYLPLVAERMALATGCSIEDVARITTQNAMRLFQLS